MAATSRAELAELDAAIQLAKTSWLKIASLREEYTEHYPKTWIAVIGEAVWGPCESVEELRAEVDRSGARFTAAQLAYLDPSYFLPWVL